MAWEALKPEMVPIRNTPSKIPVKAKHLSWRRSLPVCCSPVSTLGTKILTSLALSASEAALVIVAQKAAERCPIREFGGLAANHEYDTRLVTCEGRNGHASTIKSVNYYPTLAYTLKSMSAHASFPRVGA